MSGYRALLVRYLRPLKAQAAALAVLLLASIGLQLVQPQILRAFIDAATTGTDADYLRNAALLFIGLAIVQQAAAVLATYFSERVGWSATNALREDLMLHCLRLDLAFHKARTPGELIERIDGDVNALATFFSQLVVQIIGNALLFAGVVIVLARDDWRAALGLMVFGAVCFGVMTRLRTISVPYWRRQREASADLFGYIEERLGGTEDVRSSGAESYVLHRLYPRLKQRVETMVIARIVGSSQWSVPNMIFAFWNVAAFIYVGWLYRQGQLTIGSGFLILHYVGISFRPLRVISQQMEELQKASAGFVRIKDLVAERSALASGDDSLRLPAGPLAVEFDRVTFRYDDTEGDDTVLNEVSFSLWPGETLGLLGRTGSGKTTITRLLFRFYDPTAGTLRMGGVDAARLSPPTIRERIGLVTQDVQLFRATVRENVTLFDEAIDDARIAGAFEDLGLSGWFRALPDGLDTLLGAAGGGLSAGEAQLLAFTRVFLRDPGLVILDEASSRLDPATEMLIDRAVERLLRDRTGIIIAHRLSTISRVDKVLILEHGRTVELGARDTLVADPSSRLSDLLRAGLERVDGEPARAEAVPA